MNDKVYLIDGGLSTELVEIGYKFGDSKLWTGESILNSHDLLKKAHINFLKSGADIIETASYQLNVDNLIKELKCNDEEAKEIIKRSVRIADLARKEACCESALIAGSIGPYGACLCDGSEFRGDYVNDLTIEFLKEWHRPRLECLLEEKCDLIAFETIPSIKEATALVDLLSEYPSTKAWLAFSCKNETNLSIGDSFKDAYNKFKYNDQLIAIGINCTYPKYITSLFESVSKNEKLIKPFIVYPNDGKEWDHINQNFIKIDDEDPFAVVSKSLTEWIKLGAKYVGGCCNIGSKQIKQMRDIIENFENI